jgi:spermidine synthase
LQQKTKSRAIFGVLAMLLAAGALQMPVAAVGAEEAFDAEIRADMLKRKDGLITHNESVYNDIFVTKVKNMLNLAMHWKGYYFQESQINLTDPDDLPMLYARAVTIATIYPQEIKRVLIIGLGGGALSTYFTRFLPEATIDTVEIDPGVIDAAKTYFGIRETSRSHYLDGDGRVFLKRNSEPYDIIVADAFQGGYIPFHLMTKEFYALLRERLTPTGVAAFNILPGSKLYDSNLRTLKAAYDHIDLYHAGGEWGVIVMAPRNPPADAEALKQKAAATQERYKFRFDVVKLAAEWRIELPKELKGDLLTDDFAPVNVYDAVGRRYRKN